MTNFQRFALIIVLMIFIVGVDIALCKTTNFIVDDTNRNLELLKESILKDEIEKSTKQSEKIIDKWFEYEDILSKYVEHDEIEKISSKIAIVSENTKNKEYNSALEDIIETKYLLDHIKDKYIVQLKNIF